MIVVIGSHLPHDQTWWMDEVEIVRRLACNNDNQRNTTSNSTQLSGHIVWTGDHNTIFSTIAGATDNTTMMERTQILLALATQLDMKWLYPEDGRPIATHRSPQGGMSWIDHAFHSNALVMQHVITWEGAPADHAFNAVRMLGNTWLKKPFRPLANWCCPQDDAFVCDTLKLQWDGNHEENLAALAMVIARHHRKRKSCERECYFIKDLRRKARVCLQDAAWGGSEISRVPLLNQPPPSALPEVPEENLEQWNDVFDNLDHDDDDKVNVRDLEASGLLSTVVCYCIASLIDPEDLQGFTRAGFLTAMCKAHGYRQKLLAQ